VLGARGYEQEVRVPEQVLEPPPLVWVILVEQAM
jgi:hypothetical protein